MKKILIDAPLYLVLLLLQTIVLCQPQSDLCFSFSKYNYLVNNKNVCVIEVFVENRNKDDYVFWFDTANIVKYSEKKKINSYFHQAKGDFSLYNLMTECLLKDDHPILFGSFLKQLKKREKFVLRLVGDETLDDKCNKFLNEHFVAVKKDYLITNLKLGEEFFSWYDRQSIDIEEEYLP